MKLTAVVDGCRTAFCKEGSDFKAVDADTLGAFVVREIVRRLDAHNLPATIIDRVIGSNVATPIHAANVARVSAVRGGLPHSIPADTIGKNCGSGFAALQMARLWIERGEAECVLVIGTESMSRISFAYQHSIAELFKQLADAKTTWKKAMMLFRLYSRLFQFWKPENAPRIGLKLGLTDPLCDMIMGLTAERLAKDSSFGITRGDQDEFALHSHKKAAEAQEKGFFAEEIVPVYVSDKNNHHMKVDRDNGIRTGLGNDALTKLNPIFDPRYGTITAGNSSQISDGAAALLLMSNELAERLEIPIMGYIGNYEDFGFDPTRMGLAPVGAIAKILKRAKYSLSDFQCIEINEAFAAQTLAVCRTLDSEAQMKKWFGSCGFSERIGEIQDDMLNPNGGAIALGHPVGVTGVRLALTALQELKRRDGKRALISACVGGGQGVAMVLERREE